VEQIPARWTLISAVEESGRLPVAPTIFDSPASMLDPGGG
jgi:hypothetical protein